MGLKENLRRFRERAGFTQSELAVKAGVPFRSYQNWETGSRVPRIQALPTLAEALGVTVDDLLKPSPAEPIKQAGRPRKAEPVPRTADKPNPAPKKRRGGKVKGK